MEKFQNYKNIELKNLKNTESKLLYTKGYELDDDFVSTLENVPPSLSLTITLYLEEYLPDLPANEMVTHVVAGIVHHFNKPVPFVLEVMRPDEYLIVLTDIQFIDMDEYLDFINLKLNLINDERFSYPRLINDSE